MMENAKFLEDIEFEGEDKVRDIVFKEEFIPLPSVAIENDQASTPDFIQDAIPVQDNDQVLPTPNEGNAPEEQTQQP